VIAERDRVGSYREQAIGETGRDPDAVGCVLTVDDADVDLERCPNVPEAGLECTPSRGADDIGDEENSHLSSYGGVGAYGTPSVAEGYTRIATFEPRSPE
jgi:hypothetical protein